MNTQNHTQNDSFIILCMNTMIFVHHQQGYTHFFT